MKCTSNNYKERGFYFVTIVLNQRMPFFGYIRNGEVKLEAHGKVVLQKWYELPKKFDFVKVHEFIIMPDHFHGIVEITRSLENEVKRSSSFDQFQVNNPMRDIGLSTVIRSFKGSITKFCRVTDPFFEWQSGFYVKEIKSTQQYLNTKKYIELNPVNSHP